jgi:hypothetical protein
MYDQAVEVVLKTAKPASHWCMSPKDVVANRQCDWLKTWKTLAW